MKAHSCPEKPVFAVMIVGDFGYDTAITAITVGAFTDVVSAAHWAYGLGVKYTIVMLDASSVLVRDVKVKENTYYV